MIDKFLWLIVIIIYLYCLTYKSEVKERFDLTKSNSTLSLPSNNHEEIRKKLYMVSGLLTNYLINIKFIILQLMVLY